MSSEAPRILVVDDDEDILVAARLLLKQQGYAVRTETDPAAIPNVLKEDPPAVVLLDMNFTQDAASGREGFYWLQQIREQDPAAVVVRPRPTAMSRWPCAPSGKAPSISS